MSSRRHFARVLSEDGVVFARGTQVEMEFDEEQFVGGGVYLFASVLEHFLGLYVSMNSFSQLRVRTQAEEGDSETMATAGRTENSALARWPIVGTARTGAVSCSSSSRRSGCWSGSSRERQAVGRFGNPAAEVVRFGANPDVSFPGQRDPVAGSGAKASRR